MKLNIGIIMMIILNILQIMLQNLIGSGIVLTKRFEFCIAEFRSIVRLDIRD